MDQGNVQSQGGITLVGAGHLRREDLVESMAIAPLVVAADGGANSCISEGVNPVAVIGDFDSISNETRTALVGTRMIKVTEQDTTDFEKCLTRIEAKFVLAIGFTGGLDHELAVFSTMARSKSAPTVLIGETDVVFAAPRTLLLDVPAGTRVSLFPLAPVTGRSKGLKWPIDGLILDPLGQVGTSNMTTDAVRLTFDASGCLVIMPREVLPDVLSALVDQAGAPSK